MPVKFQSYGSDTEVTEVRCSRNGRLVGFQRMAITVLCPRLRCRAILRVPDHVRGKQVRCSNCAHSFVVPETARPNPPPKLSKNKKGDE